MFRLRNFFLTLEEQTHYVDLRGGVTLRETNVSWLVDVKSTRRTVQATRAKQFANFILPQIGVPSERQIEENAFFRKQKAMRRVKLERPRAVR